jgi:hypothetical protein
VTDLPQPSAARLQRPSWRDTRLLIGLLIVLVSIALGARAVAAADDTIPMYAAAGTLVTGRALSASDLVVVRVRLGSGAANYLRAQSPPPAGATVLRAVGAGELVPVSAIGSASSVQVRPVTVPVEGALPAGLGVGDRVDVWSSERDPAGGGSTYRPPVRVAGGAEVSAVRRPDSGLSLTQGASVQVLLESAALPRVLDAVANSARIALVPVPGTALSSVG